MEARASHRPADDCACYVAPTSFRQNTGANSMAKGHKDKVAVITGAANGIGQAFARRLAEDGVHIAVADVAAGDATAKMVEQAGRQALICKCDVTSQDSIAAMAADVQKKFGR